MLPSKKTYSKTFLFAHEVLISAKVIKAARTIH